MKGECETRRLHWPADGVKYRKKETFAVASTLESDLLATVPCGANLFNAANRVGTWNPCKPDPAALRLADRQAPTAGPASGGTVRRQKEGRKIE